MNEPTSVWQGSFRLFGVDVRCHTLSNGQRIIEQASFNAFVAALANGATDQGELQAFWRWHSGLPPKEKVFGKYSAGKEY